MVWINLPVDAVEGRAGHVAAHNLLIDAIEELRTAQDAAGGGGAGGGGGGAGATSFSSSRPDAGVYGFWAVV